MVKKTQKKKVKRNITRGICHVHCSFNNTIVTFTDMAGNAIAWASAGHMGFRGSKKSTPFAAQQTAAAAAVSAMEHGLSTVEVKIKGPGGGRENAVRALAAAGLKVMAVIDKSPLPHNGCRAPKRRRV